jgi:formate dehydrogenase subunit gamma
VSTADLVPSASPAHRSVSAAGEQPERLDRFNRIERALHWTTATLVLVAAVTGMTLYTGPLSGLIGPRVLVKDIHVVAGLAMPVPLVLAYAGRWRRAVRPDVRRLSRWTKADRFWLRTLGRTGPHQVGKFNAGQKANSAFIVGMIPVMMATGSVMRWFGPFPLAWRTGATFVHDWTAIATWLIVAGHIFVAFSKPPSLRSMVTGRMSAAWAHQHHPLWAEDEDEVDDVGGEHHGEAGGAVAGAKAPTTVDTAVRGQDPTR